MTIEPEDLNTEEERPRKDYSFIIYIFLAAVVVGGFLYWNWSNPDTSDCNYTNTGCEGDNRWGQ